MAQNNEQLQVCQSTHRGRNARPTPPNKTKRHPKNPGRKSRSQVRKPTVHSDNQTQTIPTSLIVPVPQKGGTGWHGLARGWHRVGTGWHGLARVGTGLARVGTGLARAWHGLARAWHRVGTWLARAWHALARVKTAWHRWTCADTVLATLSLGACRWWWKGKRRARQQRGSGLHRVAAQTRPATTATNTRHSI